MEILIYSLRLYYLQVKLHSSFTQHEMAKKESKEGRKPAPEILGHLHFLLCVHSEVFSAASTPVPGSGLGTQV